ncbi:hypothetical protein FB451DRAFT_1173214 [Mycena latifolia]|nr:hypothetical protein FB451DRAFT_1173214 [Mycena latifolia]
MLWQTQKTPNWHPREDGRLKGSLLKNEEIEVEFRLFTGRSRERRGPRRDAEWSGGRGGDEEGEVTHTWPKSSLSHRIKADLRPDGGGAAHRKESPGDAQLEHGALVQSNRTSPAILEQVRAGYLRSGVQREVGVTTRGAAQDPVTTNGKRAIDEPRGSDASAGEVPPRPRRKNAREGPTCVPAECAHGGARIGNSSG